MRDILTLLLTTQLHRNYTATALQNTQTMTKNEQVRNCNDCKVPLLMNEASTGNANLCQQCDPDMDDTDTDNTVTVNEAREILPD